MRRYGYVERMSREADEASIRSRSWWHKRKRWTAHKMDGWMDWTIHTRSSSKVRGLPLPVVPSTFALEICLPTQMYKESSISHFPTSLIAAITESHKMHKSQLRGNAGMGDIMKKLTLGKSIPSESLTSNQQDLSNSGAGPHWYFLSSNSVSVYSRRRRMGWASSNDNDARNFLS